MNRVISRLFIVLLSLILLGVLFLGSLPIILSSSWGTKQLNSWLNASIPGHLDIKKLNVSWISGQTVEGLSLKDPEGNPVVELNQLTVQAPLWRLIIGSTHLGEVKLQDLNGWIRSNENGISNLQYALGILPKEIHQGIPNSSIVLSDFNALLTLDHHPLSLSLQGKTRSNNLEGSVEIDASLPGVTSTSWSQLTETTQNLLSVDGSKDAILRAKIVNFPTDLLDRLIALKNPESTQLLQALLGNKIDLSLDKVPHADGIAFDLIATAPHADSNVKGLITNDKLTLREPSTLNLHLEPVSLNPLLKDYFKLNKAATIAIAIQELVVPFLGMDEGVINPSIVGLMVSAKNESSLIATLPFQEELTLDNFTVSISSPVGVDSIVVASHGKVHQPNQEPFTWILNSSLDKAVALMESRVALKRETVSNLKISHLPLGLIPTSKQAHEWIDLFLGHYADIEINAKQQTAHEINILLGVKTDQIAIDNAQFDVNKSVKLLKPLIVEGHIQPNAINKLFSTDSLKVEKLTPFTVSLHHLDINLKDPALSSLETKVKIPSTTLATSNLGSLDITNLLITTQANSFDDIKTVSSFTVSPEAKLAPILGKKVSFDLKADISLSPTKKFLVPAMKAQVKSDKWNLALNGKLTSPLELFITEPLEIHYNLSPNDLAAYQLADDQYPKLQNTPHIILKANPFNVDLKYFDFSSFILKGDLLIDTITLQEKSGQWVTFQQIETPWEINGPNDEVQMTLSGEAFSYENKKPIKQTLGIQLSQWLKEGKPNPSDIRLAVFSRLAGLPTSLFTSLIAKNDLSPILGSKMDLEFKMSYDFTGKVPATLSMVFNSTLAHLESYIMLDEMIMLDEDEPLEFRITVTPETYQYLAKLGGESSKDWPNLQLPITITGRIGQLTIPYKLKENVLANAKIEGSLNTSDISWKNSPLPSFKLIAKIKNDPAKDLIAFKLQSESKSPSSLSLKGSISHLNNFEDFSKTDLTIDLNANQFPSAFFLAYQKQLGAAFGKELNAQASVKLQKMAGPISATIQGLRGKVSLDGQLAKGVVTLQKPLEFNTLVSAELGQAFNLPLFKEAIESSEPLKLQIDPTGFKARIIPFALNEIEIPKGSLTIGKVVFFNKGDVNKIISILKPRAGERVNIWFTPVYFQLAKGELKIQRMDMLIADDYHLAAWGLANLVSKNINMTLGISGQALQNAVSIHGLSDDYLLQVPLKGSNGSIELDKANIAARIAALAAQSQANDKVKLLGTLLDAVASGGNSNPPTPTTQPFPWGQSKPSQPVKEPSNKESSSPGKEKKKSKKQADPLKELEKGASSILNELLK